MELRKLRYFVVLADELHFGRAAKRLHITQPPLSMAMQTLEQELGVRLFVRSPRRVSLTQAGSAFLHEARALLARAEHAAEIARAAERGHVGRMRLGFMSAAIYTIVPPLLREFSARFPGVKLELRELAMPRQRELLRADEIDLGVLRPSAEEPELEVETLLREPLVVVLPEGHSLARHVRIAARRLATEPFVMFQRQPGLVLHDLVLRFCLQAGFTPRVAQEATESHAVVGLVSAGIGVALAPASVQNARLRGVVYRPLREKPPSVPTALAWRRADRSPALSEMRIAARQVAARYAKRTAL